MKSGLQEAMASERGNLDVGRRACIPLVYSKYSNTSGYKINSFLKAFRDLKIL